MKMINNPLFPWMFHGWAVLFVIAVTLRVFGVA